MNQRQIIDKLIQDDMFTSLIGRKFFRGFEYIKDSKGLFIYDGQNRISKDMISFAQELAERIVMVGGKEIIKRERDRFLEKFLK
jgi:hypothetical protein